MLLRSSASNFLFLPVSWDSAFALDEIQALVNTGEFVYLICSFPDSEKREITPSWIRLPGAGFAWQNFQSVHSNQPDDCSWLPRPMYSMFVNGDAPITPALKIEAMIVGF